MRESSPNPFVHAIRELGPVFQAGAAASDASGEFVSENYEALKQKKLFSAGVPKDQQLPGPRSRTFRRNYPRIWGARSGQSFRT